MSGAIGNASSLRTPKALLDEGVLDEDEFRAEKAKLLRSDVSPMPMGTTGEPVPAMVAGVEAAMVKLSSMADAMTQLMATAAETNAAPLKRTHSEAFSGPQPTQPRTPTQPTVWVPPNQPTLFQTGVRKVIGKKKTTATRMKMLGGGFKCPHCDHVSKAPGPLAMHLKHSHSSAKKDRSVLSLFANQGVSLSERQRLRDRDV